MVYQLLSFLGTIARKSPKITSGRGFGKDKQIDNLIKKQNRFEQLLQTLIDSGQAGDDSTSSGVGGASETTFAPTRYCSIRSIVMKYTLVRMKLG